MDNRSAVIVLYEQETDSLILTLRSPHMRSHPGEICFPGGRWEWGDKDLWATALRELQEELAITADRVQYIGELNPEITLRGTIIHPWLASISSIHPYKINELEVAALVTLPLKLVLAAENYHEIEVSRFGKRIKSWQFTPSEKKVWGATARIMKQLCKLNHFK
jgi:8-oxo-dGTP pyrophosphatase MutT (NUDIX family)